MRLKNILFFEVDAGRGKDGEVSFRVKDGEVRVNFELKAEFQRGYAAVKEVKFKSCFLWVGKIYFILRKAPADRVEWIDVREPVNGGCSQ